MIHKNNYHFNYSPESKKNRLKRFAYNTSAQTKNKIRWDDEGLWSLTHKDVSILTAKRLLTLEGISKKSIITDAMAGIGGITIPFAKVFANVNAIELAQDRKEMLEYNIKLYNINNVTTYSGYCQDILKDLQQDVVIFDPPWGIDYKKYESGEMRINIKNPNGIFSLEDLVNYACKLNIKYVVVKFPVNYDFEYFETMCHCEVINTTVFNQGLCVVKIIKVIQCDI